MTAKTDYDIIKIIQQMIIAEYPQFKKPQSFHIRSYAKPDDFGQEEQIRFTPLNDLTIFRAVSTYTDSRIIQLTYTRSIRAEESWEEMEAFIEAIKKMIPVSYRDSGVGYWYNMELMAIDKDQEQFIYEFEQREKTTTTKRFGFVMQISFQSDNDKGAC